MPTVPRRAFVLSLPALLCAALVPCTAPLRAADAPPQRLRALIVDGRNNHNWKATTPLVKAALEQSGRFVVEVATAPADKEAFAAFRPKFADYAVVVSNYNGELWPEPMRSDFDAYVRGGGGFVAFHAANNSFPQWPEYNRIIGLGGWGGRNEKSGPYLVLQDGKWTPDPRPGRGGAEHPGAPFVVETFLPEHPVMRGLPAKWLHAKDQLVHSLRGPAEGITVLAMADSPKEKGGFGGYVPMVFTVDCGKGRVFHTPMGHDTTSVSCAGFVCLLQRGTEWAATGAVTLPVPDDLPTPDTVRLRTLLPSAAP